MRNELPWQFLDFVKHVEPKAVIIENVAGMRQDFRKHGARSPFDDLRIALSCTGPGYVVQPMALNAMHFGVPQHRPRVFLVGLRRDLADAAGIQVTSDTWLSQRDTPYDPQVPGRPALVPKRTHFETGPRQHLAVRDAISDLGNEGFRERAVKARDLEPVIRI